MLTKKQIGLINHTMGREAGRKPYRNFFTAEPGHPDWEDLLELVAGGYMLRKPDPLSTLDLFQVTKKGRIAVTRTRKVKTEC